MIIKSYVTLGFMSGIDNMMTQTLPPQVIKNAKELNKSGVLVMPQVDRNSWKFIWKRFQKN